MIIFSSYRIILWCTIYDDWLNEYNIISCKKVCCTSHCTVLHCTVLYSTIFYSTARCILLVNHSRLLPILSGGSIISGHCYCFSNCYGMRNISVVMKDWILSDQDLLFTTNQSIQELLHSVHFKSLKMSLYWWHFIPHSFALPFWFVILYYHCILYFLQGYLSTIHYIFAQPF